MKSHFKKKLCLIYYTVKITFLHRSPISFRGSCSKSSIFMGIKLCSIWNDFYRWILAHLILKPDHYTVEKISENQCFRFCFLCRKKRCKNRTFPAYIFSNPGSSFLFCCIFESSLVFQWLQKLCELWVFTCRQLRSLTSSIAYEELFYPGDIIIFSTWTKRLYEAKLELHKISGTVYSMVIESKLFSNLRCV